MFAEKGRAAIAFFLILNAAAFAAPYVLFVQPESGYTREDFAFLNASISGTVDTFRLNWDGTNATVYAPLLSGAWKFNGNADDWSPYGNNGILLDGNASNSDGDSPPAFATGKFGQGLQFDGYDDYFNISAWTDSAGEVSIEAWIFKKSSKNQDILTKKWDGDNNGYKLWVLANDRLELQLRNITDAGGYLRSNLALLNNTWYHVAGTYDGAEMRLYINGNLDNSKYFAGGMNPNPEVPVIGAKISARTGDMAYVFNGTLDEVRVYSRAKSPGEINLTYNSGLGRYYMNKTGLSEGVYSYYAWANDSTGEESQTSTKTLTVDWSPPYWLQTPQDQSAEYGASVYYDLNASDNFGILQYSINDTRFKISQAGVLENGTLLAVGTYGLKAAVNDSAGNANSGDFKVTVQDTVPPAVDIQFPAAGNKFVVLGVPLNFTAWDLGGVSACRYELANSSGLPVNYSIADCQGIAMSGVTEGSNSVKVWAGDAAGNWNSSSPVSFNVDVTRPRVSVQNPQNASYTAKNVSLNFIAGDSSGISGCWYSLDDWASNHTLQNCQNTTITANEGANALRLAANDTYGNLNGSALVHFTVDTTPPEFSAEQLNESAFNGSRSVKFTFNATDDHGIGSCWAELVLEDGSRANASGSMDSGTCTVTGSIAQVGDFSFKPYANDTHGNVGNGTLKAGVRILLEWGPYQQDATELTIAGGAAYVTQMLYANNTLGSNATNNIPTGVQARAGWNCIEQTPTVSIPAGAYLQLNANNCSNSSIITKNEGSWSQVIATGSGQSISRSLGGTNNDPLLSYSNVYWSTANESSACWSSQQASGSFNIPASGSWAAVANMSGDCISEGAWTNFTVYGTPTEESQNITKSRAITNDAGIAFSGVPWSTANDSSACWKSQTPVSGAYDLAGGAAITQSVNMSGDCINVTSGWGAPQVKGVPAVTGQVIYSTKTISNLDADYKFTNIYWSNVTGTDACWTGGATYGYYNLTGAVTIEANRTGDCIQEENADKWRQDTARTTAVNGTAYVTSNYTIKNLARYNFSGLDLAQNITNRTGWSCAGKIETLNLTANADDYYPQAINCSKGKVITKNLAHKKAYNSSVFVGEPLFAFYNFTVENADYLPYLNVFANYTGDIDRSEWRNTSAEEEYLNISGSAILNRIVNVSNATVLEEWGGCSLSQAGAYRKHGCTANLSVHESELTRGLPVVYSIALSRLYLWEERNSTMTEYRVDGTAAGVGIAEGTGVNLTIGTGHDGANSLAFGMHPVEFVFYTYPPALAYEAPTEDYGANISRSYVFVNVTSDQELSSCLLEWDGANESAIASGKNCHINRTGIPDGGYSYKVWANNTVGNWKDTPLRAVLIDTTPPIVNLSYPDGWRNALTLAKSESDPGSGIAECRLEYRNSTISPQSFGDWILAVDYPAPCPGDGPFISYLNSFVATHNRSYQFRYSAKNRAGLWGYANITNATKLDLTPPSLALSYADGWINDTLNISLAKSQWDDESGVGECVLQYKNLTVFNNTFGDFDAIGWANVSSQDDCALKNFSGANGRAYKFRYNVKNTVGNWSGWTAASETAKLDTTPPEFVNVTYADAWHNETRFGLSLWGNDSQSGIFDCDLEYRNATMYNGAVKDGYWDNWTPVGLPGGDCSAGYFDGWQGGAYQFRLRMQNYARLWSNFTNSTNTSMIDLSLPRATVSYHGLVSGWQTNATIEVDTVGYDNESGVALYELYQRNTTVARNVIDGGGWTAWSVAGDHSGMYQYGGADGYAYKFKYRVKNNANRWSDDTEFTQANPGVVVLIDTTPADVNFTYPDFSSVWVTALPFSFTKKQQDDPQSDVWYCNLSYKNETLSAGDILRPGAWTQGWTFAGSADDCALANPAVLSGQAYMFRYNVTNKAGNTRQIEPGNITKVDTSPPQVDFTYPLTWLNESTAIDFLTYSEADPQSGIESCNLYYKNSTLSNGNPTTWEPAWKTAVGNDCGFTSWAALNGQAYRFNYTVRNRAGLLNITARNDYVKIDVTKPIITSFTYFGGWKTDSDTIQIAWDGTDAESGLSECNITYKRAQLNGGAIGSWDAGWTEITPKCTPATKTISFKADNGYAYNFTIRIKNNASLWTDWRPNPNITKIDTSPPSIDSFSYNALANGYGWQTPQGISVPRSQSDSQSGISSCSLQYKNTSVSYGSVNESAWSGWKYAGDCAVSSPQLNGNNGNAYKFSYTVTNGAGVSRTDESAFVLKIDTTPPVSLDFNYSDACTPPCWGNWRKSNPIITFSPRSGYDPESGIECDLLYRHATATAGDGSLNAYGSWTPAGGGSWGDCSDTFDASPIGAGGYRFNYTIRNYAGTPAPQGYLAPDKEVKLEFTPPEVAFTYPAWVNDSTTIGLPHTQSDGESGIPADPNGCALYYKSASIDSTYGNPPSAWDANWVLNTTSCGFTNFLGSDSRAYKFNYTVTDKAGLITAIVRNDWTAIDNSRPSPGPSISYQTGWKTDTLDLVFTWGGNDSQSGIDACDLEYKSVLLKDHAKDGGYGPAWNKAACTTAANPFVYTAANGYAYTFRFNVRNKAGLWYSSYYTPAVSEVYLDVTPPAITLSYRTGWINTSADRDSFSLSHTQDDPHSGLKNCTILYKKVKLDKGSADMATPPWAILTTDANCGINNPLADPLTENYSYIFNYTVWNKNYPQPNTVSSTAGSEIKVDITPPVGVGVSYPDGWLNTTSIPITRAGEDPESGIADCDLEYKEAMVRFGVIGDGLRDTDPWYEAGGADGLDCSGQYPAKNGYAYKFRYRLKDYANLWSGWYESNTNVTRVDATGPETAPTIDAVPPSSGWYTSGKDLMLNATDNESSAPYLWYKMDGGNYSMYTAPFPIEEGVHTYSYYSRNLAGLTEGAKSITIKKDTTSPVIKNVKHQPTTVEKGGGVQITVSANITDLANIVYAGACNMTGCTGEVYCTMGQTGGIWSCNIPASGRELGNYPLYVFARDENGWTATSALRSFKVRRTELLVNGSSGDPMDMQSTGTIIAFYRENDGTSLVHISKADCVLKGDFTGAMVDTGEYYAKIVKPARLGEHTYTVNCSKANYVPREEPNKKKSGKDLALALRFASPLEPDLQTLQVGQQTDLTAVVSRIGQWGGSEGFVQGADATVYGYILTSTTGDRIEGNLTWDGSIWYATFNPDYGNYTAVVHFVDNKGIGNTSEISRPTSGALELTSDAPKMINVDIGSSSLVRVYVENKGKKEHYYNFTVSGNLNIISLDGAQLSGKTVTVLERAANNSNRTHYIEIQGRMISQKPEELFIGAANIKSSKDSKNLTIRYQVTNKPVYGVRVAPDMDVASLAMLLLLGLAYLSRRK